MLSLLTTLAGQVFGVVIRECESALLSNRGDVGTDMMNNHYDIPIEKRSVNAGGTPSTFDSLVTI